MVEKISWIGCRRKMITRRDIQESLDNSSIIHLCNTCFNTQTIVYDLCYSIVVHTVVEGYTTYYIHMYTVSLGEYHVALIDIQ